MSVRETSRFSRPLLAGAVALALTGTGVAFAWAASDSPTPAPSQSQSAPGQENKQAKPDKSQWPRFEHGEHVVKNADGSFQTILEQRGTVEAVSGASITVRSDDGFSQAYTVNGETKVTKLPAASGSAPGGGGPFANPGNTASPGATGDDGKRVKPTDGTIADIATGDSVRIAGVKDGDQATAKRIVKGGGDGPGLGLGRGHAGPGKGMGQGESQGKGHGQGKGDDSDDNGTDDNGSGDDDSNGSGSSPNSGSAPNTGSGSSSHGRAGSPGTAGA